MIKKPVFNAEKLALLRATAGITQRDLAEKAGTTCCMISRYEAGSCQPRLKAVLRLEAAFNLERGGLYL